MGTWIYRLRPTRFAMLVEGPTPEEQRLVGEHFAYLQELTRRGVVHLAGRTTTTDEDGMGIVLFSSPDEESARALMEADPAVRHGVMGASLFPFRLALLNSESLREAHHAG